MNTPKNRIVRISFFLAALISVDATAENFFTKNFMFKSNEAGKIDLGESDISTVAFHPQNSLIAVKTRQSIQIWNWSEKRKIADMKLPQGARDNNSSQKILFSPDGNLMASCYRNSALQVVIKLWETKNWALKKNFVDEGVGSNCAGIEFSNDGKILFRLQYLLPPNEDKNVIAYDTSTFEKKWALKTLPFYTSFISKNPQSNLVAIGGEVKNPKGWPFNSPVPSFGSPSLPDTSLVLIVNSLTGETVEKISDVGPLGTYGGISWRSETMISIAAGGGITNYDLSTHTKTVVRLPVTDSIATTIKYDALGTTMLDRADSKREQWLRVWAVSENKTKLDYNLRSSCADISADGKFLVWSDSRSVFIEKLSKE